MEYKVNKRFKIDVGFSVRAAYVLAAATETNQILGDLPASLYKCIDFKTVSAVVGAVFCDTLAVGCKCIVNPIEKGHPDLVPLEAKNATEASLRNYPRGLEVKSTVGNVKQGANLRAGQKRISSLTGITWQAHHREVCELMGITWDFAEERASFCFPCITGIFYSSELETNDWGAISGTTGRNTKVTGMKASGKSKMGKGWIILADDAQYLARFSSLLSARP